MWNELNFNTNAPEAHLPSYLYKEVEDELLMLLLVKDVIGGPDEVVSLLLACDDDILMDKLVNFNP